MNVHMLKVSALEKVFFDEEPRSFDGRVQGFLNEGASFQAAWTCNDSGFTRDSVIVSVRGDIKDHVSARAVRNVPVLFPTFANADDNYLRTQPGLYPDLLTPVPGNRSTVWGGRWTAFWFEIDARDSLPAGEYEIEIALENARGETLANCVFTYSRLNAELPKQKLMHTKWFHSDGLCDVYGCDMFSEEYWRICEKYMRTAAKRSINTLLTPVHTPPLDTMVGGERRTCQLVDIVRRDGVYSFSFDKLRRWVRLAQKCGIEYFEIAHLFTQWGAEHAPKIMAEVDGEYTRIFGWETDAASDGYAYFLSQYLPALTNELESLGISDKCVFHISDEPSRDALESYARAKNIAKKYLSGYKIIDAMSDVELYKSGAVDHPVPSIDHIGPFLNEKVEWLWTYYCISQYKNVSNAFVAMPSARTRILGLQMYIYSIVGFLQWGYNFYNSQYSTYPVNPFMSTDGDGFSPAGDCYVVYPGAGGEPLESIRMLAFSEGVNDMRALQMLEDLTNREYVMNLINGFGCEVTFDKYPISPGFILSLRKRVNSEIISRITRA